MLKEIEHAKLQAIEPTDSLRHMSSGFVKPLLDNNCIWLPIVLIPDNGKHAVSLQ